MGKTGICVKFYYDTCVDDLEEIDLEEEEKEMKFFQFLRKKKEELGVDEFIKIQKDLIKEYKLSVSRNSHNSFVKIMHI